MKSLAVTLLIPASLAFAQADVAGTWQSIVESGQRQWLWTIELEQQGTDISGTVHQGITDASRIEGGEVLDDTVRFFVDIPDQRVVRFEGGIRGDEIRFERMVEVRENGAPGGFGILGQNAVSSFTVRRVPSGQSRQRPRGDVLPVHLVIVDDTGKVIWTTEAPGMYRSPVLSPDGTRLAFIVPDRSSPMVSSAEDPGLPSEVGIVRVIDVASGGQTELASAPRLKTPIWSPDGKRVAYSSYRNGHGQIHARSASGTGGERLLLRLPLGVLPAELDDWSGDGRMLGFTLSSTLNVLTFDDGSQPHELLRTEYRVRSGAFAPANDLYAFLSDENHAIGDFAIHVRSLTAEPVAFSNLTDSIVVEEHAAQDSRPIWRSSRREDAAAELFYQNAGGEVMSVRITRGSSLRAERPRRLFRAPDPGMREWFSPLVSASDDGERFVFAVPAVPTMPAIPASQLERYAGSYTLLPDSIRLTVTLEDGRLWAGREDDFVRIGPMLPVTETLFYSRRFHYSRRFAEEIEFVMDDAGNVTHLMAYMGGIGNKAVRN